MKRFEYTAPSGVHISSVRAPVVLDRSDTSAALFLAKSLHMWGGKVVRDIRGRTWRLK